MISYIVEVLDPISASLSDFRRTIREVEGVRVRGGSFDARPLCVVSVLQVVLGQVFAGAHID